MNNNPILGKRHLEKILRKSNSTGDGLKAIYLSGYRRAMREQQQESEIKIKHLANRISALNEEIESLHNQLESLKA